MNKRNDMAYENIADFDYIDQFEIMDYFYVFQNKLVDAFDDVTTFDMRKISQISLQIEDCEYDRMFEKDGVIYPVVKLVVLVRDWNYIKNSPCRYRKGEFELTITPFNVSLDKFGEKTGVYGGYDKELTKVWRRFLKQSFPKYEHACREYCNKVKELKMQQAQRKMADEENRIEKEFREDVSLID